MGGRLDMPAKLMRCVSKVMKRGKPRSQAFAICTAATGLKVEKKKR